MEKRISSIDILRGAIMILMAIDHVRVYSGQPAGGATAGIFFTRWITHFCAPGFVFFAGTSAFLYGRKINKPAQLSSFLLTRGLILVVLELTVIRFCWMFNFNYADFTLAGIIWMIGCCMVLLAAFVRLRANTIGIIGLIIIFGQQLFSFVPQLMPHALQPAAGWIWSFFYPSEFEKMPHIAILFVIIPWIGVMMTGYAFGQILLLDPAKRNRICLTLGCTAIVLFLVIGSIVTFGNSSAGDTRPALFRLLAQQKYPPTQLFLSMTLGPLIALIPFAERSKGWFANVLLTFGRVPMFYYVIHILLIHCSALLVNLVISGSAHQDWYASAPFTEIAETERWSLPLLYLVFAIDVTILYFVCRAYGKYKRDHAANKLLRFL